MSVVGEVRAAYGDLDASIRERLAERPSEASLLVQFLMVSMISFVAGLPGAWLQVAAMEGAVPLQQVLAARLFGALFLFPLMMIGIAGLVQLVALAFGGARDFQAGRIALAWALVVALPLLVIAGAVSPLLQMGIEGGVGRLLSTIVSLGAFAGFLWIWLCFLVPAAGLSSRWRGGMVLGIIVALLVLLFIAVR